MAGRDEDGRRGAAGPLLSERLLVVLTREMDGLERASRAARRKPGGGAVEGGVAEAIGGGAAGAKTRIEAVGQMTRTLEKLLELKRLEALAAIGGEEGDEAEAARLRDELMRRLRALDARRRAGPALFGPADVDLRGGADGQAAVPVAGTEGLPPREAE